MTPSQTDQTALALGRTLRARRKALGISMAAAAEAAGMSRLTWHRLENGKTGVALGYMLAAARVLDMQCRLAPKAKDGDTNPSPLPDALPLNIRMADYPGLNRLAWQLREGVETLAPREAWELYERNGRHLDPDTLEPREQALMRALRKTFGSGPADV